jgi:hypothetical protein
MVVARENHVPKDVVVDACVWHAAFVRDLLVHLAVDGIVSPIWSAQIEREWTTSVCRRRPEIEPARVHATAALIRRVIPQGFRAAPPASIVRGLIARGLPDPDDAHVIALAISDRVPSICTFDRRGFPPGLLRQLGIATVSPDQLLSTVAEASRDRCLHAIERHRRSLRMPAVGREEYLAMFRRNRLPVAAARLESMTWPNTKSPDTG